MSAFPADLYLSGAAGFTLCAKYREKGCAYALILLAISGIAGHLFLESHHFLRLGIEASFAIAFFIASLAFDAQAEAAASLETVLASREASLQNLEEEIGKAQEAQVEFQLASQKKWEELQKNYDDLSVEKSSLEILNDVLRKANGAHWQEKSALETQSLNDQRRLSESLLSEQSLKAELERLKKTDLPEQNRLLQKELNAARFDREEMRLINETLVRMHAEECVRAKEAEERMHAAAAEKCGFETRIQAAEGQVAQLEAALGTAGAEKVQLEERLQRYDREIERLGQELSHADAKRQEAENEIERLQLQAPIGRSEAEEFQEDRIRLQEHLAAVEAKVAELAKVEVLYRQLKGQFEEKNRILHDVRASLFKAETELETIAIEKEEQSSWLPENLRVEFDRLDDEMNRLEAENKTLQELITALTEKLPQPQSFAVHRTPLPAGKPSLEETLREALIPKRKKKAVKKPAQQDLLF